MQNFRRTFSSAIASTGLIAFIALAGATLTSAAALPNSVTIRNYFKVGNDSLTFNRPLLVKPYPGEDSAFVVLQQSGQIVTVRWNGTAWRKTDSASITVTGGTSGITEQGLLGFAFHPQYLTNRKYYVYYVTGANTTQNPWVDLLVERTAGVSGRPATSDAQRIINRITDPYDNHNAGTLGFDKEGYLVYAIGDGGTTQGDPQNRAQNPDSLLGKFMRLDVDGPDAYPSDTTRNYAIPATNPYKDSVGVRPEIWARGVRNPWKWSFHPVTGDIWVGDVGQDTWEEISRVPKGGNLGWRQREGNACYNPSTNCLSTGLQAPALVLPRSSATCITGGVFFAGASSAEFNGTYIFGDHGTHRVWAARLQGDTLVDLTQIGSVNKVASFDRDRQGRVLATTISPTSGFAITSNIGRVMVLESPDMTLAPVSVRAARLDRAPNFRVTDVARNPDRYVLRSLDGAELHGIPRGAFFAAEKAHPGNSVLMTGIR
jgi:glucose/arabinose dehydrogenase